MKISVVTVCFNAVKELEETMLSVLGQDYADVDYIVIDGGSTDGTVDIIRKYADRLAYWVSEPDKGIYDAMNKGIAAATGDYINFMNAGDKFANPSVLNEVAKFLGAKRPDILYGDVLIKERGIEFLIKPKNFERIISDHLPFCHQSSFVATNYHKRHLFDTTYRCAADYNMFYQAYFRFNTQFIYLPIVISIYDESTGFSKANMKITHRERYRIWGIEKNKLKVAKQELKLLERQLNTLLKRFIPIWILRQYRK